ncbi:MAG: hypothetical protein Q8O51_01225 [bacterium]|nr:hypothetical protein [bacterium]
MQKSRTLAQLVAGLQRSPRVRGIFYTGSTATHISKTSDIDLVIILDRNTKQLRSIYTMVQGHFADIFFFDLPFLKTLQKKKIFSANTLDGIFVTWLRQGKIMYDPTHKLQRLQATLKKRQTFIVSEQEKLEWWVKINYNRIANERYARSSKDVYKRALELRLLYSVTELTTAYFAFRGIPWRGEKAAFAYLAKHDSRWVATFSTFVKSAKVQKKMQAYRKLFAYTCTKQFGTWGKQFFIPMNAQGQYDKSLVPYWKALQRKP